jgi:hypothetical protein
MRVNDEEHESRDLLVGTEKCEEALAVLVLQTEERTLGKVEFLIDLSR